MSIAHINFVLHEGRV